MNRVFAVALCLWPAACHRPELLIVDAPSGVDYFTLITLGTDGEAASASPLFRLQAQGTPLFQPEESLTLLAGWSALDLGAEDEGADRYLGATVSTRTEPCESRWPTPNYVASWEEGGLVKHDPPDTLVLGSPDHAWCPSAPPPRLLWGSACLERSCPATVVPDADCHARIVPDGCGPIDGELRVEPNGRFCVRIPDCDQLDVAPPGAVVAEQCGATCVYDAQLEPPALAMRASSLSLLARPDYPVAGSTIGAADLLGGYALDLVRVGDSIIVSTTSSEAVDHCGRQALGPSLLHHIDLISDQRVAVSTAAPCLRALSPYQGGFAGVYREADRWWLGRFDAEGRKIGGLRIDASEAPPLPANSEPVASEILYGVIAVLFRGEGVPDQVWIDDLEHPGATDHHFFEAGQLFALASSPSDSALIVGGVGPEQLHTINVPAIATGRAARLVRQTPPDAATQEVLAVAWDETARQILAAAGPVPALHRHDNQGPHVALIPALDSTAQPTAFGNLDSKTEVVALSRPLPGGSRQAQIALFDLETSRWVSQSQNVGRGAVRRVLVANGRIYLLLPWSAELVIVTP